MHDNSSKPPGNPGPTATLTSVPAARRGRPPGDHEAKRADLLRAAISVLAQEGHAGASLRKVAKRAGCTTGSVTYYFANKEAMFTAVADKLFDEVERKLQVSRGRVDIRAVIETCLAWTNAGKSTSWLVPLQLFDYARLDPAFGSHLQQRYARIRAMFASILAAAQRQRSVRDDVPAALLADQLSAISDGWMMMFPIEPDRFTPDRIQALLDTAISLITPPSSAAAEATPCRSGFSREPR